MKFAVIQTGGKQYKVTEGDVLNVEKLPKGSSETIAFDKVLLIDNGKDTMIGAPYLDGAVVTASRVEDGRDKKITVIKYKNKIRYKKTQGHRQPSTKIKIEKIGIENGRNILRNHCKPLEAHTGINTQAF